MGQYSIGANTAERIFEKTDDNGGVSTHWRKQIQEQLRGFPEVHWAAAEWPLDADEQGFPITESLQQALAAFYPENNAAPGFFADPLWDLVSNAKVVERQGKRRVFRELKLSSGEKFFVPNPGLLYPVVHELAERGLDAAGLAAHLAGNLPANTLKAADLFQRETRPGIALDAGSRTAQEGALYTTEAIAFKTATGFLVGIDGDAGLFASSGLLRLGGDGKGAAYKRIDFTPPATALADTAASRRFRVILATPGIFTGGWLPDGVTPPGERDFRLQGEGFSARLVCAAVPRFDIISGWDLALRQPKTAQRVAPAGSVYWFDQLEGDVGKLAAWVASGLWGHNCDKQRRAEGFNLAWLANWKETQ